MNAFSRPTARFGHTPEPETPYQRLLKSTEVSDKDKAALRTRFQGLNPIELKKQLEEQLRRVYHLAKTR